MSKIIGSKVSAAQFNVLQEEEVGHFLLHLLEKPDDLVSHIKRCVCVLKGPVSGWTDAY